MFSGFTKLISDELTQFDINSLTSFDDLQNTLDPALAATEKEAAAARQAERNSGAEEAAAAETNDIANNNGAPNPSLKGSAESTHADLVRGQAGATAPRLAALPKAAARATEGSKGSSGAVFFSSFAAPTALLGALPATAAVAEAGGDAAELLRLLRRELEEAKELASSEGEQRKVFEKMVRGSAQSQVSCS